MTLAGLTVPLEVGAMNHNASCACEENSAFCTSSRSAPYWRDDYYSTGPCGGSFVVLVFVLEVEEFRQLLEL